MFVVCQCFDPFYEEKTPTGYSAFASSHWHQFLGWRRTLKFRPLVDRLFRRRNHTPAMPFIVGAGRSGTTLLRLMLDAHPEVAVPPETCFLEPVSQLPAHGEAVREAFCRTLVEHSTWSDHHVSTEELRAAVAALRPFRTADGVRCFYRLYAARHGKRRWGDKTPHYGLCLDRIARLLPEARFIHIIRDGRDVALSLRRVWFAPSQDIETLARYWRDTVTATQLLGQKHGRYCELRYEELLAEPEVQLRRLCRFLNLDYDPAMLEYHRRAAVRLEEVCDRNGPDGRLLATREQRLSQHVRTSGPPDTDRIGNWRRELSADEVARFETIAGPLLRQLGHPRSSVGNLP